VYGNYRAWSSWPRERRQSSQALNKTKRRAFCAVRPHQGLREGDPPEKSSVACAVYETRWPTSFWGGFVRSRVFVCVCVCVFVCGFFFVPGCFPCWVCIYRANQLACEPAKKTSVVAGRMDRRTLSCRGHLRGQVSVRLYFVLARDVEVQGETTQKARAEQQGALHTWRPTFL